MTTGGRGRSAPEMTPLDGARMIIALLTTDGPSQCVERVKRFSAIPFSPEFKKNYRGYETITPQRFAELFRGQTLEEVLAHIISLPGTMGLEAASGRFLNEGFHLRIYDFDVLAELFRWEMHGQEIVGELVVPFKGKVMCNTDSGFKHIDGFEPILGGIRTKRSCVSGQIFQLGVALACDEQKVQKHD